MNWDAIAAIGQMLGSVAVFVTFAYLAVQVRQSTVALGLSADRGVYEDANAWRYRLIENPEVTKLYVTGMRTPDALSPDDKFRFRMLLDTLFDHWQFTFLNAKPSLKAQVDDPRATIPQMLAEPGGAAYWSRARGPGSPFDPAFIRFIDGQAEIAAGFE